jgi:hypothetical protein
LTTKQTNLRAFSPMPKKIIDANWMKLSNDAKLLLVYLHYNDNPSGFYRFYPSTVCKKLFKSNDFRTRKAINEIKKGLSDYIVITKAKTGYDSKINRFKSDFIPVFKEVYETIEKHDLILSSKIIFWTINNLSETADFIDTGDHINIKIENKLIRSLSYSEFKKIFVQNLQHPEFSITTGINYKIRLCLSLKNEIKENSGVGKTLFAKGFNELLEKKLIYELDDIIFIYGLYEKKETGEKPIDPFKELRENFEPLTVEPFDSYNVEGNKYFGVEIGSLIDSDLNFSEDDLKPYLENKYSFDIDALVLLERIIIKLFFYRQRTLKNDPSLEKAYLSKLETYMDIWFKKAPDFENDPACNYENWEK